MYCETALVTYASCTKLSDSSEKYQNIERRIQIESHLSRCLLSVVCLKIIVKVWACFALPD